MKLYKVSALFAIIFLFVGAGTISHVSGITDENDIKNEEFFEKISGMKLIDRNCENNHDLLCLDDGPGIKWDKTFHNSGEDYCESGHQTTDNGYILAGYTRSFPRFDVWLIKTDSSGNKLWDKTYNKTDNNFCFSVQQTNDEGYILSGATYYSNNVSDVWLIKTDSSGNKLWDKTYGGSSDDLGYSVQQTSDGGYIIAGITKSFDVGEGDIWLIKTGSNGIEEWNKTFGGSGFENAWSVKQTNENNFIIAGNTNSFGAGNNNIWLIKTDNNGNKLWDKTFGEMEDAYSKSVQQTVDGGYIITGGKNGKVWLIKTDIDGNKEWDQIYHKEDTANGDDGKQTSDGGYILTGNIWSNYNKDWDIWLIKTDSNGNKEWDKTIDNSAIDYSRSVQQTIDKGFIIIGGTGTSQNRDGWLIKVASEGTPDIPTISGPASGKAKIECEYIFSTSDPEDEYVYYYIEWGDGHTEEWRGPFNSGEQAKIKHIWEEQGTYVIRAKAKDVSGDESGWSTLSIIMPKNKPYISTPFLQFLESHSCMFSLLRQLLGLQ